MKRKLVHFNDSDYKDILNQSRKKCFVCGRYCEYLYIEDIQDEYTIYYDYIAVCDRCINLKGDKSILEFKKYLLDLVKKIQNQHDLSLVFELGLVSRTDKNIVFYGEKISRMSNKDKQIIRNIKNQVAEYYNMEPSELDITTRKREIVWARQVAHTFSRFKSKGSLSSIGREIGKVDHATVLHSMKTVANLYDSDPEVKKDIDFLSKVFDAVIE